MHDNNLQDSPSTNPNSSTGSMKDQEILISKNSIINAKIEIIGGESIYLPLAMKGNIEEISSFPTTRFYGSKRRQLKWLKSELEPLNGVTALDAFGGTGSVSFLLNNLGWETTYNDIFDFNLISARALFTNYSLCFSEYDLATFLKKITPSFGFISQNFHDIFFTDEENKWLDGFMLLIRTQPQGHQNILLYCLFQACLKKRPFNLFHRANLNLRNSTIPVQFGNRTTWNKSFEYHITTTFREISALRKQRKIPIQVTNGMCANEVNGQFDLIYLDPPYFKRKKRNTESYLDRYHFLEGLARFDEWPNLIDENSAIKSFKYPYRKEWDDKYTILENIKKIMTTHQHSNFVLSYVANEEPSHTALFNLFLDNFDKVRLSQRSFTRALSKSDCSEIILIGRR